MQCCCRAWLRGVCRIKAPRKPLGAWPVVGDARPKTVGSSCRRFVQLVRAFFFWQLCESKHIQPTRLDISPSSGSHTRAMARLSRDGDPPPLKGIFAGGELREGHSLASARTYHEAQRYALNPCNKSTHLLYIL